VSTDVVAVADVGDEDAATTDAAGETGAKPVRRAPVASFLQVVSASRMEATASTSPHDFQVRVGQLYRNLT